MCTMTLLIEVLLKALFMSLYHRISASCHPIFFVDQEGQPHLPIQDTGCPIRAAGPQQMHRPRRKRTGQSDFQTLIFTLARLIDHLQSHHIPDGNTKSTHQPGITGLPSCRRLQ